MTVLPSPIECSRYGQDAADFARNRETDLAIARAILDLAANRDEAERIWAEPTEAEIQQVTAAAWLIEDAATRNDPPESREDTLFWGQEAVRRPSC